MTIRIAVHVVVSGSVQGVGHRAFVEREAVALGLSGWVRNRRDGSVEAVFCGTPEEVETMLAACLRGPRHARVTAVERLAEVEPLEGPFLIAPSF